MFQYLLGMLLFCYIPETGKIIHVQVIENKRHVNFMRVQTRSTKIYTVQRNSCWSVEK